MILLYIKFGSGWLVGGWLRPKKKLTILLTYLVNGKSMGLDEVSTQFGGTLARGKGEREAWTGFLILSIPRLTNKKWVA